MSWGSIGLQNLQKMLNCFSSKNQGSPEATLDSEVQDLFFYTKAYEVVLEMV